MSPPGHRCQPRRVVTGAGPHGAESPQPAAAAAVEVAEVKTAAVGRD